MYATLRHRALFIIPCALALLLAFAACGINSSTNGLVSSQSAASPTASTGVLAPTLTSTITPFQKKNTIYGCPSNQVITLAPPAATVTLKVATKKAIVNQGGTVNIELPFGVAWSRPLLDLSQNVLAMQSPAGDAYPTVKACIWHFTVVGSGTASISFFAYPICQPGHACPRINYSAALLIFTVVSK